MNRLKVLRMTKYLSKKTVVDGIKLQVPFCLYVNSIKICTYKADFVYCDKKDKQIVEDVKGFKTPVYRLKKKLFEALFHPLKITEI